MECCDVSCLPSELWADAVVSYSISSSYPSENQPTAYTDTGLRTTRLAFKLTTKGPVRPLCNTSTCRADLHDVSDDKKLSTMTGGRCIRSEEVASSDCNMPPYASTQSDAPSSRTPDVTDMPPTESVARESTTLTNDHAITVLKTFLSADNLASSTPTVHTANTLQSLYRSARARHQTTTLEPRDYTALISIFGSLSLSSVGQPYCSVYAHPFTPAVLERTSMNYQRPYWAMVAWLIRERTSLHGTLSPSDHYYAMRAHLAKLLVPGNMDGTGALGYTLCSATYLICHYRYTPQRRLVPQECALPLQEPSEVNLTSRCSSALPPRSTSAVGTYG